MKKTNKKLNDKVKVTFQIHMGKDQRDENLIDKTLSELQEKIRKNEKAIKIMDKIGVVIYYLLFIAVAVTSLISIKRGNLEVALWQIITLSWIFLYRFKELENKRIQEVADTWYKKLMDFYDRDIENSLRHLDIVTNLNKKLSETKKLVKNALAKIAKLESKKRVSRKSPKRR